MSNTDEITDTHDGFWQNLMTDHVKVHKMKWNEMNSCTMMGTWERNSVMIISYRFSVQRFKYIRLKIQMKGLNMIAACDLNIKMYIIYILK